MSVLMLKRKNENKNPFKKAFLSLVFAFLSIFSASALSLLPVSPASAAPITFAPAEQSEQTDQSTQTQQQTDQSQQQSDQQQSTQSQQQSNSNNSTTSSDSACYDQTGAIGWLVCPSTGVLAKIIDGVYSILNDFLTVKPLVSDLSSPIYQVWSYVRGVTNIVFIIFILIIIISQLTGVGISNYGIKSTLPKIIIAAILVNLSWIICVLAVDLSNILGTSLRSIFTNIEEQTLASGMLAGTSEVANIKWGDLVGIAAGSTVIAGLAIGVSGGGALFWVIATALLSGVVAVVVAVVTVAARQAFIYLLIMISPLAFVCYLLPNTNSWFNKWKSALLQMLIFFPAFAVLFGASSLAGWVIIASAKDAIQLILGMAVKIVPLFMSWSMLKMSGTIPGQVSAALTRASAKPLGAFKSYAEERRNTARAEYTARNMKRRFNPLSGGSLNAKLTEDKAKRADRLATAERRLKALSAERVVAAKDNRKIIGYDENGRPIYEKAKKPLIGNSALKQEFLTREDELRLRATTMRMDNHMNSMSTYLDQENIKDAELSRAAYSQGQNYLNLRTEMSAARANTLSDERFYHNAVKAAAERNADGTIKDLEAYNRLILEGAGADAHIRSNLEEGTAEYIQAVEQKNLAVSSVIADSYEAIERERKIVTQKYTTYLSKQVTKEVLSQYESMLDNKNIEGIVASQNILAMRGDYDQIKRHLRSYLDKDEYLELGSDFANTLALNLLGMKDADPELARLGKHINVETWHYTDWDPDGDDPQRSKFVTYKEFMTGKDANGIKTKYNIKTLLRGTGVKGIDRTFYGGLKETLDEYCTAENFGSAEGAKAARIDIMNEMLPQIISALPTFAAGSEQITNTLNFLTGFKCGEDGNWTINKPSDRAAFERNRSVHQEMTKRYLEGLTANDLVNMKTDTFNALLATFKELYGSEEVAHEKFLDFTKNQRAALAKAEPGVLAPMKVKIRKYLGLAPED